MYTPVKAAAVLAFAQSISAHSWVENVMRIASNGTMVGEPGYARGWMARTEPGWGDAIPQHLLPPSGQAFYSGEEVINKYEFEAHPKFPMLKASPGDHIALLHTENGHTTLPQNQPFKPKNRGTVFIYGTSQPKRKEKLFDVHLRWSRDGTGGDKRGRLLAAGNYDDGQCFQPNPGPISNSRAQELANDGANHDRELLCQSDIQLPSDLKAGSVYTLYWYWDWPDLNAQKMNVEATKNGIFPWAGTFMRGEKDPHGFTMDAISRNESYASTIDIQIVEKAPSAAMAKQQGIQNWISKQDIYSKAIKEQMGNNFQVDIDANGAATGGGQTSPTSPVASSPVNTPTASPGSGDHTVTVTVTQDVAQSTETVFVPSPTSEPTHRQPKTSTVWKTAVVTETAGGTGRYSFPPEPTRTFSVSSMPLPTKTVAARRNNWAFGIPDADE